MKKFKIKSVMTTITTEVYESIVLAESEEKAIDLFKSGEDGDWIPEDNQISEEVAEVETVVCVRQIPLEETL